MGAKGNALYYATENEVYAGPIDNFGTAKVQWTPEPGETITGMEMYRWPGGKHEYEDQANGNKARRIRRQGFFLSSPGPERAKAR